METENELNSNSGTPVGDTYGDGAVKALEGIELIRKRPTLFIDGLDEDGLHRLVMEAVDNAVDEFMAGFGNEVTVTLGAQDGAVTIKDGGRGMPIGQNEKTNLPTPVFLMTIAFAGAKFDSHAYGTSGGIHGVGLKCINAFSEYVELFISKGDGKVFYYKFIDGRYLEGEGTEEKVFQDGERGTAIRFLPKYEIFKGASINPERVSERLEDASYLNPGLTCTLINGYDKQVFHNAHGVVGFLEAKGCSDLFSERDTQEDVSLEIHLGVLPHGDTLSVSYANGIPTGEGGSHVVGAKTGIARAATSYGARKKLIKDSDPAISFSDTCEGCFSVISIKMEAPPFSSQRKTRIVSSLVESTCGAIAQRAFEKWLEEDPKRAKNAVERMLTAARNREKLRAAKDRLKLAAKSKKTSAIPSILAGGGDELLLSIREPRWRFLGGEGIDVLPIRFKSSSSPTRTSLEKLLKNTDYFSIAAAIGAGVGDIEEDPEGGFVLDKCKYNKIIVACPTGGRAQLAGANVLLFIETHFPGLIESGRVFWKMGKTEPLKVGVNVSLRGEGEKMAVSEDENAPQESL